MSQVRNARRNLCLPVILGALCLSLAGQAPAQQAGGTVALHAQQLESIINQYITHAASRQASDEYLQLFHQAATLIEQFNADSRQLDADVDKHNQTCSVILNNIAGQALAMMCLNEQSSLHSRTDDLHSRRDHINQMTAQLDAQRVPLRQNLMTNSQQYNSDLPITDYDNTSDSNHKVAHFMATLGSACASERNADAIPQCRRVVVACMAVAQYPQSECELGYSFRSIDTYSDFIPRFIDAYRKGDAGR